MNQALTRHAAFFCLFAAVLATSPVTAQDSRSASGSLKLVTGPHYPPYAADYLPHKGLGPFLATRILGNTERSLTVDMRPWKRAYREALEGQYDAVLPYVVTPGRQEDYLFSVPIFETRAFAYVMKDSELDARSLEGLRGLTYCNPIGFTDEDALEKMRSDGLITRFTPASLESCFNMLRAGRVDFVKTNELVADYVIAASDLSTDEIRSLPFVVEEVALHLMVPRARPGAEALIDEFNERFRTMKDSGRIDALRKSYLESIDSGTGPHRIGPSAAGTSPDG